LGECRGHLTSQKDRDQILSLISEAKQAGARYWKACEILNLHPRTLQRWQNKPSQKDGRLESTYTPSNRLSEAEKKRIIEICNQHEYADMSPEQIVPKLADLGIYIASERSFYRVLKEANQLKHRGIQKPRKKREKPKELVATGPNQVHSWDITYLPTHVSGLFFYLYMVVDIFSRRIVGWQVHDCQLGEHATQLMQDVCIQEGIPKKQLVLHSDNGSPMKCATLLATLDNLGVAPSFSRPRVSNDNPYSESLFKTTKYHPEYPKHGFANIEQARTWVESFVHWYNSVHCHSKIKYVTPNQRHLGQDRELLIKRQAVYEQAKAKRPDRWSGETRNWKYIESVSLNPGKSAKEAS